MKALALMSLLLFSGISYKADAQLLPTKLRVTVIDGLGNFVAGASVAIYEDEENYLASEGAVATLTTDSKGRVTFKGVKPVSYFIEAKKGDQSNNGEGVQTAVLAEGRLNKVNTVIE